MTKSLAGLSMNSIICYGICLFSRIMAITFYDGYLPEDMTGDYIYRISEYLSFFTCVFVIYLMNKDN